MENKDIIKIEDLPDWELNMHCNKILNAALDFFKEPDRQKQFAKWQNAQKNDIEPHKQVSP